MVQTMESRPEKMLKATKEGFLNATDVADYLAAKGVPFREAHEVAAKLVSHCFASHKTLEDLTLEIFKSFNPAFDQDIFQAIDIRNVLNRRTSKGGPAEGAVKEQLKCLKERFYHGRRR